MPVLHPKVRELLESDALAHLVTLNPDRSPQLSCVWVGLDGDQVVRITPERVGGVGPWVDGD